ncbi:hypothetical protein Tco_0357036, partial [Tanacetum coccineum]
MIQHEFITLTLAQFDQILKIPYNGQAFFTNEWDLASLEYSQETEGPYYTDLPTPNDIRRFLESERVVVDRTIKSQTVSLNPNQILTKELSPDMKQSLISTYWFLRSIDLNVHIQSILYSLLFRISPESSG